MLIETANKSSVECDIIAKWKDKNENYIAYTNGTLTENGKLELFVSKFTIIDGEYKLTEISEGKEWENAINYLNENYFNEEGFDE